jgi:hypothetical protein
MSSPSLIRRIANLSTSGDTLRRIYDRVDDGGVTNVAVSQKLPHRAICETAEGEIGCVPASESQIRYRCTTTHDHPDRLEVREDPLEDIPDDSIALDVLGDLEPIEDE